MSPRYKAPSLEEDGLKKRCERYDVDYDKLVMYFEDGLKNAPIATILSRNRGRNLDSRTVARWRKQYEKELKDV